MGNAACFFSRSLSFEVTFVSALSKWHSLVNSFVCELKVIVGESLRAISFDDYDVFLENERPFFLLSESGDGSLLVSFVARPKSWARRFSFPPEGSLVAAALSLGDTVSGIVGYL